MTDRPHVARRRRHHGADRALVQITVRLPEPLDDRLSDLVHALRHAGVRSSKAELTEMALWELPAEATLELQRRLDAFRRATAPEGDGTAAP